jgi:hypothetical protein
MKGFLDFARAFMPGSHIHDHQMRLFMKLKFTKTLAAAAAQGWYQRCHGLPIRA